MSTVFTLMSYKENSRSKGNSFVNCWRLETSFEKKQKKKSSPWLLSHLRHLCQYHIWNLKLLFPFRLSSVWIDNFKFSSNFVRFEVKKKIVFHKILYSLKNSKPCEEIMKNFMIRGVQIFFSCSLQTCH